MATPAKATSANVTSSKTPTTAVNMTAPLYLAKSTKVVKPVQVKAVRTPEIMKAQLSLAKATKVVKPVPVKAAPVPVKAAPVQVKTAPVPVKTAPVPVKTAPVPVKTAPVPVKTAPVPVKTAPVQVKTAPVQVKTAPVPVKTAPVPVKTAPVPVKTAPVPVKTIEDDEIEDDEIEDDEIEDDEIEDDEIEDDEIEDDEIEDDEIEDDEIEDDEIEDDEIEDDEIEDDEIEDDEIDDDEIDDDEIEKPIYKFTLKEICDPKILQECLVTSRSVFDKPTRNSYEKYVKKHFASEKDPEDEHNTYVYVCYSTITFKNQSIGRMYASISKNGIKPECTERRCMTFSNNMPKILRDTLCADLYYDIDFKNSHPSILLQLLEQKDIKCKYLKYYVNNRDKILEKVCEWYEIEREAAKHIFMKIMYGGSFNKWKTDNRIHIYEDYKFIINFYHEIRNTASKLLKLPEFSIYVEYAKKTNNSFSAMSYILMTIENKCLVALYKHYISLNYTIGSFEYDGLKVRKNFMENFPEEHLLSGQDYIKQKTGYDIELVEKPMEKSQLLLPGSNIYNITTDMEAAEIIIKNEVGTLIYSDNNIYYKYLNLWRLLQKYSEMHKFLSRYKFVKENGKHYNGDMNNIEKLSRAVISRIEEHPDNNIEQFDMIMTSSTIGKICFKNGIYDYNTKELIPWNDIRANNVYSTIMIDRNYNPNVNDYKEEIEYVTEMLSEQCGKEIFTEFMNVIARATAGYVKDKRWITLFGSRNSGKGVFCDMLYAAFGKKYITTSNSNNFVRKQNSGDSERNRGWIMPLRFARIVICNEIDPTSTLDGTIMKDLFGGGDDVRARPLFNESVCFKHQFTLMICCNDMPKVDISDTLKTRVVVDMPYSYVSEQELLEADEDERKTLKLAINDIKEQMTTNQKYIDAFTAIVFNHFIPDKPTLINLKEMGDDFVDNPADVDKRILKYFIIDKKDRSLITTNFELRDICNKIRADLYISDADDKIKKLLVKKGAEIYRVSKERGLRFVKIKQMEN
jgi:hypothetical protein